MQILHRIKTHRYLIIFLGIYLVVNFSFLTDFPFVHSDEPWLSGLARNMADSGRLDVTESFFDLKERNPHAIKTIFHVIQIFFMKLFGYNIFSMRLVSLIFSILTLTFFFKLAQEIFHSRKSAFIATLLLGLDIQFIYASHFARQEIILVFTMVLALYTFIKHIEGHKLSYDLLTGIILGLSIGVHPNSFIISLPLGFMYLYHVLITRKLSYLNLLVFILPLFGCALLFVSLSLSFDPDFFAHYAKYGSEFEVFNPLGSKLAESLYFYTKIFYRISGTYYTPEIKLQFFLFAAALLTVLYGLWQKNGTPDKGPSFQPPAETFISLILAVLALNLGIILVGRYNQTSVVFQFPLFYLLLTKAISFIPPNSRRLLLPVIIGALLANTWFNITPYLGKSYDTYLSRIGETIKPQENVLANLNTEYYFKNGKLYDYRNLAFLREKGLTLKQYITRNRIQYIIYPEELDVIYRERPRWNGMYGPPLYYDELKEYLSQNAELAAEFTDSLYGMRIVGYQFQKDWKVWVYRVKTLP